MSLILSHIADSASATLSTIRSGRSQMLAARMVGANCTYSAGSASATVATSTTIRTTDYGGCYLCRGSWTRIFMKGFAL